MVPLTVQRFLSWIRGGSGAVATALLLVVISPGGGGAQQTENGAGREATTTPTTTAERITATISVDGRLDEAAWEQATPITRFTQVDPREGAPASQPTEVRILYDDEALYIGAWLADEHGVSSRMGRRDASLADSDWFSVTLDSYHDHQTAYRFMVNPSRVRVDEALSGGDADRGDESWNPVWTVATEVTDSGWVAEMRIPFDQLRFRRAEVQTWGIQIGREIARRQEETVFAFTPKSERGGIARFGHLTGLQDVRPSGRWEILPYVVGRAEYRDVGQDSSVGFADPFRSGSDYFGGAGVDVKYRVTSNLILNATLNPDFGQIEADPAEVNLTAFESRFDERRPFFVEGSEIFRFGGRGPQFFYSRRVGRSPQVTGIDGAAYSDVPDASTILGAAKLTGKMAGGWSIGVLEAVTQREVAPFVDAAGTIDRVEVEPLSNYFVARARREMREGQTLLGAIVTAANRDLSDARVRSELRSAAYAGGVDFQHEWANRSWSLSGHLVGTHIRGEPGVILDAQRAPGRYYQRPDALYLTLDSTATALSGYAALIQLEREAGLHWRGGASASANSPGFEVNDLGFFQDVDRLDVEGDLVYVENRPGNVFREWNVRGDLSAVWNYGGDFLGSRAGLQASGELLDYWGGEIEFSHSFAGLDDRLTRGGPLARAIVENGVSLDIRSDDRQAISGSANLRHDWDEAGGWSRSFGLELDLRPAPNWSLSLGPEVSRSRSAAQYLTTVEDPVATETFGHRYLFASLDRTTVSMRARLNMVFTPDLTLEVYAEPFLASGAFGSPKELAAPRTFDFRRYGDDTGTIIETEDGVYRIDPDGDGPAETFEVADRDFHTGSLRGNAVLRWEWRPGSTLFFVWQQERSSFGPVGRFRLGPGFEDLWAETPDNVLLVKVSYWMGL